MTTSRPMIKFAAHSCRTSFIDTCLSSILHWAQSDYTKEHREATQALLRGFVGNIVEGVAASRALSETEVSPSLLMTTCLI